MSERVKGAAHATRSAPWFLAVAVLAAVGNFAVGEFLAAVGQHFSALTTVSAPLDALGDAFITITPGWLKDFAVTHFGSHDKVALIVGMLLSLVALSVLVGVIARRRPVAALATAGGLAVLPLLAVATRPSARPVDVLPGLLGAAFGLWLLAAGIRIGQRPDLPEVRPAGPVGDPEPEPELDSEPDPDSMPDPETGGPERVGGIPAGPPAVTRRAAFRWFAIGAAGTTVAATASRLVPRGAGVAASRAQVGVPDVVDRQSGPGPGLADPDPVPSEVPPVSAGASPGTRIPTSRPATAPFPTAPGPSGTSGSPTAVTPSDAAPSDTTTPGPASADPAPSLPPSSPPTQTTTTPAATPQTTTPATAQTPATTSAPLAPAPTPSSAAPPGLTIDGLAPYLTDNSSFYRVDTTLDPPLVKAENWRLRVHGRLDAPVTLDYRALVARPQIERAVTLTCVSNPVGGDYIGNARWIGARLDTLLQEVRPHADADCVLATSVDGWTSTVPLAALTDGRDALLAVAMNGQPLPVEHGFPVRMVVPGLYGYVSACKWVVDLEVTRFADVTAYWTQRGWAEQAPVKTSSRVDVPGDASPYAVGDRVTIAGVAWAQHRGIVAVQVQIDDGDWLPTELGATLSVDTWVQWRTTWTAVRGDHTIRCRAIDGLGRTQDATEGGTVPDGATGLDSISVRVT